jgi:hypothetical protein
MALSIFSSEKRVSLSLGVLLTGVILIALLNVGLHILKSASGDPKEQEKKFLQCKINPGQRYDMVLLGDSRCLTGVDPSILEKRLSLRVYNDSFSGGGLNQTIYTHVQKNILKTSPEKIRAVVFCITPLTLSSAGRENKAYYQIIGEMKQKQDLFTQYGSLLFKRIRTREIKAVFRKKKPDYVYHKNGYLERFSIAKAKAQRNGMRQYKVMFSSLTFPEISLKELAEQTRQWRKENIAVFAFYPPSRPTMEDLERNSAWDWKKTIQVFRDAGGIYLEIDNRDQYNAYDSIHLASGDSKKLSEDLAKKIEMYLKK